MKIIKIWDDRATDRQLDDICRWIESGETVVLPTDSRYALACDALQKKPVEGLCRLKGVNPKKTNLSIICSDISMASEYARFDNKVFRLIHDNTPGPFTFICPVGRLLPKIFKERREVGIRIPDCEIDRQIVARIGHPLLVTSVSNDDEDYLVNPDLMMEQYENHAGLFIQGDTGRVDTTTVIDCTGDEPEVVREGLGRL